MPDLLYDGYLGRAVRYYKSKFDNCVFVVASDDVDTVRKFFDDEGEKNVFVSQGEDFIYNTMRVDLIYTFYMKSSVLCPTDFFYEKITEINFTDFIHIHMENISLYVISLFLHSKYFQSTRTFTLTIKIYSKKSIIKLNIILCYSLSKQVNIMTGVETQKSDLIMVRN